MRLFRGRPARRPLRVTPAEPAGPRYRVVVLDNPRNTYEQVITVCMVALGCSAEAAYSIAWEIDHLGSAVVLEADEATAREVAGIIETIGIEVRVESVETADA